MSADIYSCIRRIVGFCIENFDLGQFMTVFDFYNKMNDSCLIWKINCIKNIVKQKIKYFNLHRFPPLNAFKRRKMESGVS